jgi:hypothetical protein
LASFFTHAQGFLLGRERVDAFTRAVGESPSGSDALEFYAVLVRRNLFKIMREVFPALFVLIRREHPGLWNSLIDDYAREHPPRGWDPNHFAAAFPGFLGRRHVSDPRVAPLYEELADLHWIKFLAWSARDELPAESGIDGLNHRLFVRQYSRRVPAFALALPQDHAAELPPEQPTPTLIYRDPSSLRVKIFYPTAAALAVLAQRRRGRPHPESASSVPGLTREAFNTIERELLAHGVLLARAGEASSTPSS